MIQDCSDFIELLYYSEYDRLFNVAYWKTNSWEAAQDLVHETFLLALFHQEELIKHPKPDAWLLLTICNLIANRQRTQWNKTVSLDEAAEIPETEKEIPLSDFLPVQLKAEERKFLFGVMSNK